MTKGLSKLMAVILSFCLLLAGCMGNGNETSSSSTDEKYDDSQWIEAKTTPYGKYPEEVVYTLGKTAAKYDALIGTKYEGDNDENNAWTRYAYNKLNIKNENLFEANDGSDYEQKVSMAIVSRDIPDIMLVSDFETLNQLYDNDMIEDLTVAFDNCASDRIKEMYASYGDVCLNGAKIDGKLMGLPTTEISHGPGILWLRQDWMDELGLEAPKTMDDIEHILQEFLDKDPGGNGAGKTVGLVIDPEIAGISGNKYMVNNIFAYYNAYPKQWMDDGSGNAIYGSIQPEMREPIAKLADWYSKGLIDKQLAVRTGDDRKALLASGSSGAAMLNWWGGWQVVESLGINPDARWLPCIAPLNEDGSLTMFSGNKNSSYMVVRKGFEHPELLMKLASLQYDYFRYEDSDPESNGELVEYISMDMNPEILGMNIDWYDAFPRNGVIYKDALETGDISKLNIRNMALFETYKDYVLSVENGEEFNIYDWAGYVSDVQSADLVASADLNIVDPIFFGHTPSMSLKWPTLEKMELEMYLKIITGEEPIEYFDSFVDSWKKTGGDEITQEVNDALNNK